ncbi:hypothetical protein B932_0142 [Gluconobacter oxydans H24]|nr:hypothetical protein B932_0142 [Gluconobacter oxydans H24]
MKAAWQHVMQELHAMADKPVSVDDLTRARAHMILSNAVMTASSGL